jgi:hypothetical protein
MCHNKSLLPGEGGGKLRDAWLSVAGTQAFIVTHGANLNLYY